MSDHDVLSGMRILVVDDEVPQMRAICDTLQDHGYAATGFASGPAALAEISPGRFDLLLSDLMMPEMDGVTLLQQALRRDGDLIGIIMTGAGTIATAVEAMKAGAFDYLLKPFKLSTVLPVLSRAMSMRRLRQENVELQKRVQARTAELEDANRELEAFSYSVSHDLRAPLRIIGGFTRILMEDHAPALPEEVRKLLDRIAHNATRMDGIIIDLLRLASLGRKVLAKEAVDMTALAREVADEQRREDPARSVAVTIHPLPPCQGDRSLLRQVYTNLLSNAFKYSKTREHAVVEVGCVPEAGQDVYYVRDNGVGFDPRGAGRLFMAFSRLHTEQEFTGTGVGLSIVQRIVRSHGGRIWAESELGQGAIFRFALPR